jgi:hypothetical protein
MMFGFWLNSPRFLSAGGQDEQHCEVKSSTTIGASFVWSLSSASGALEKLPPKMVNIPNISAPVAISFIM